MIITQERIEEIVCKAIPLNDTCAAKVQQAKKRREKLKAAIEQILKELQQN